MCPSPATIEIPEAAPWNGTVPPCVPDDNVSQAAFKHAATNVHPLILAHSIRVFLLAQELSQSEGGAWHLEGRRAILFTACLFHDIGTAPAYASRPVRFEIEGADAACYFLSQHAISTDDRDEVWRAITLHNTPQISERFPGPGLVRLVRLAVVADFKRNDALDLFKAEDIAKWEDEFPRGQVEKILGDAVVEQAVNKPEKAPPACWPGGLYRAHLQDPDWTGVNKAF